jgi:hypothetical protein
MKKLVKIIYEHLHDKSEEYVEYYSSIPCSELVKAYQKLVNQMFIAVKYNLVKELIEILSKKEYLICYAWVKRQQANDFLETDKMVELYQFSIIGSLEKMKVCEAKTHFAYLGPIGFTDLGFQGKYSFVFH